MRDKKGIGAIFAWIFILLAGAMIITLFIILAQGQAANAKDALSQRAFQNVNTILTTQQTTSDIATDIAIPDSKLRLTCTAFQDETSVALLNQLDIGGYAQNLETQLIVGRDMDAQSLSVFSKRWNAPFHAGNILYVSSPVEMLLYHGNSSSLIDQFNQTLPDNINRKRQNAASGYQNLRAVYVGDQEAEKENFFNGLTSDTDLFIQIIPDSVDDITASGKVIYHTYRDSTWAQSNDFYYAGEAVMLAYVWQGDADRAACLQHKLAETLKAQIEVQLERVQVLRDTYGTSNCQARLSDTYLIELNESIELKDDYSPRQGLTLYSFDAMKEAMQNLKRTNERLQRGESCATIY